MSGRRVRKLLVIAAVGGATAAVVKALRGDPAPQFSTHPSVTGGPPEASAPTPTPTPAPSPTPAAAVSADLPRSAADQAWVEPVDGACPDGFPIKAKLKSGIFHQPGGPAYERTKPDRCYPTAETAEADGLRPPKR